MVDYRIEVSIDPSHVSRKIIVRGIADWTFIHRQVHKLAKENNETVLLYTYNSYFYRWDYIGKALPNGEWYDWHDKGPYELSSDGLVYHKKKGGDA